MKRLIFSLFIFSTMPYITHGAGEITVINKIIPKNGAFVGVVDSSQTLVNTATFNKNLGATDTDVQHALQTIDQLTTTGGSGGYAVEPATKAFQLNQGFSASTGIVSGLTASTVSITGTVWNPTDATNRFYVDSYQPPVSTVGNLSRFFTGSLASKKIAVVGNSVVQAANEFFIKLSSYASSGSILDGIVTTPVNYDGYGWIVNIGNIYNNGYNGGYAAGILAQMGTVAAENPDLVILEGPIINDVREGACNLPAAQAKVKAIIDYIVVNIPNADILLLTENSLLSDDPGGYGWIIPISTDSKAVDGVAGAGVTAGSHTIKVLPVPTSLYVGGQIIVNDGKGDKETIPITAIDIENNTFAATFGTSHSAGFTVRATTATAAQAYSIILREAVTPFFNSYPNLVGVDMQTLVYGQVSQTAANSPLMLNALHPGPAGRIKDADLVAAELAKAKYKQSSYPSLGDANVWTQGQNFSGVGIGSIPVAGTFAQSFLSNSLLSRYAFYFDPTFHLDFRNVVVAGDVGYHFDTYNGWMTPNLNVLVLDKNMVAISSANPAYTLDVGGAVQSTATIISSLDCSGNANSGKVTIGTNHQLVCADDISGAGGGGGSLEVFSIFENVRTSPTASIGIGDSLKMSVSGSTAIINVDQSSVAFQSDLTSYLTNSSATATYQNKNSAASLSNYNVFTSSSQMLRLGLGTPPLTTVPLTISMQNNATAYTLAWNADPLNYQMNLLTAVETFSPYTGVSYRYNYHDIAAGDVNDVMVIMRGMRQIKWADGTTQTTSAGMTPNATYYINNTNTLQSGATFYVSSGTINNLTIGRLPTSIVYETAFSTQTSDIIGQHDDLIHNVFLNNLAGNESSYQINITTKTTESPLSTFSLNNAGGFYFQDNKTLESFSFDGTSGFLTVPEITLPTTGETSGEITIGGTSFLHSYGDYNTFLGAGAGNRSLTGNFNTGIGRIALQSLTSGSQNIGIGSNALYGLTSGSYNMALGVDALGLLTDGENNTAMGNNAMNQAVHTSYNTAIGESTLFNLTTGNQNTAVGRMAGYDITIGSNNVFIGYSAGYKDTFVGGNGIVTPVEINNATAIGYGAQATSSNTIILGGTGPLACNVGIGTTTTIYRLDVNGVVRSTGTITTGYMTFGSQTIAQINALVPTAVNQTYFCSDCTTTVLCVSTGTASGSFSSPASKTTHCQ